MPNFVNTVDLIGDDALTDSIIDRSITEYADNNITSIGQCAFRDCSSLASIDFPSVTIINNFAFCDCSSLASITFPSVTRIEQQAFTSCGELTSVDFPLVTYLGDYAFSSCEKLASANFSLVTRINQFTFGYCLLLASADFPSVTRIDDYAFSGCSKLTTLILRNTDAVCTLSSTMAFESTPIDSGTGYIYVPSALIESYKVATNWSTYANQFRALENYTVDGTTTGALDASKVNA